MPYGDPSTIQILELPAQVGRQLELRIDGCRRAVLNVDALGAVSLYWEVAGSIGWPEARTMVLGLLELITVGDHHQQEWEARASGKKGYSEEG